MKAQTKISFLIASFIFMIFIAFSSLYFSERITSIIYETKLQYANIKAELISHILVKEEGIPRNWEVTLNPLRLGLTNGTSYVLSTEKINALASHCELFENSFQILNYKLTIVDEANDILLTCGSKGGAKAHIEKAVFLDNGKKARLILDIWW